MHSDSDAAKAMLYLSLSLAVIFLTVGAYRLLDAERSNVGAIPRAIDKQGDETRKFMGAWLTANVMPPVKRIAATVDGLPAMTAKLIDRHATRIEDLSQKEIRHGFDDTLAVVNKRTGDVMQQVVEIRGDLRPVFAGATALTAAYTVLPDRLGAELRPAWLSLEPEITCRTADGFGYGGCARARVNALLGEAVKVGGVFTQKFPAFADASLGIEHNVQAWTDKYVMPHKLTPWGKVKVGIGVAGGVGIAGARMGLF